jgi:hypothetical protein
LGQWQPETKNSLPKNSLLEKTLLRWFSDTI